MKQLINNKKEEKKFGNGDAEISNYLDNMYFSLEGISDNISRVDFKRCVTEKYSKEEILSFRSSKFVEIANKFTNLAIEKKYNCTEAENPELYQNLKSRYQVPADLF